MRRLAVLGVTVSMRNKKLISRRLEYYKDFIWETTKAGLKLRYGQSALGFIWVFLKPFATFVIILAVFSFLFVQEDQNYKFNLLVGLLIFYYFSEATTNITNSLLAQRDIILKLDFSRLVILISSVLGSLLNFIASMATFFLFWFLIGESVKNFSILGFVEFLFLMVVLTVFIMGFGFFMSIWQIKLRDMSSIWELLLRLLMYGTPIIYPLSILPDFMQSAVLLNPLTIVIEISRALLLNKESVIPDWYLFIFMLSSTLICLGGYFYFSKNIRRVSELM